MSITVATFEHVRDLVRRESAIVLGPGKEYLVESRLLPLARAAGAADVDTYLARCRTDPAAQRAIVEALTTNETSWFRDGDPFQVLRTQVFPDLATRRAATRRLRVWSAACSSGQEPLSVAITAGETPALAGWSLDIVGTDLSEEMLARARAGRYTQLEVNRGLPVTHLVRHFTRDGADWKVSADLARQITYRTVNLAKPLPPLGTFDVVLLRNVLIYFDQPTKQAVLHRVRQMLAPDGYLFLGAAEMTRGTDDSWDRVPAGRSSMYRPRKEAA